MNITTIIPIHKYNEKIEEYLAKACESIIKQEESEIPPVIIVHTPEIEEQLKAFMATAGLSFTLLKNDGDSSYQSQVNLAVNNITTDYFSVLEFDDEYSNSYFKNAVSHINAYPEIDVFLSMMIEVNELNQGIKLTNETVWAQQFVGENGEMGYLNAGSLKQMTDFKLSGAVIKKSEFLNIGGYKNNIKLTFMFEYLLRALNNACKIYTIPKIGYKHLATREDSLFDYYLKNMPVHERKFWFETATSEANFMNDRKIDLSKIDSSTLK